FTEENHLVCYFLYRYVEVLNPRERGGEFIQFMVMSGEERLRPCRGMAVKELSNSPSDGYAVVGTGAPPDFVEQNKAALREVVHDTGRLVHVDHERRFARREII